jgi:hypothetical protein
MVSSEAGSTGSCRSRCGHELGCGDEGLDSIGASMINGDRRKLGQTPVASPRDRFCARSPLLPVRKGLPAAPEGADSTFTDRHLGNVGSIN